MIVSVRFGVRALQIDERMPTVRMLAAGPAQDANYELAVVRDRK